MYKYKNSLKHYDEAKYPYSVEFIKEGMYNSLHGECVEKGFNIMAGGSKHLFCTPGLSTFNFKAKVIYSHYRAPFRPLCYVILMGYDKRSKHSYGVQFNYVYKLRELTLSLVEISGLKKTVLEEKVFKDTDIKYHTETPVKISADGKKITGSFGKFDFDFDFALPKGRIGLDIYYVSGGIIFSDVKIESKEEISKKKVFSRKFNLPQLNGGVLPYTIAIELFSLGDGNYEMKYNLTGGTNSIPSRNIHSNVWSLSFDDITNMYIKTIENGETKKYYLFNGTSKFCDPNMREVFQDFFLQIFDMKKVPLKGSFAITNFPEDALLSIGYEHFSGKPYMYMEGASEYIYDKSDKLIYSGEPLEKDIITRIKSVDKKIIKKLPKTLWHYDDAVNHAENNHYFYDDETPKFSLRIISRLNLENMKVKVTLQDAYFEKIKEIKAGDVVPEEFSLNGYGSATSSFKLPKMKIGVYHISADIYYGDKIISNRTSAFEVMNEASDMSPQEASALPHLHLGDAGPNLVFTGAPDFYAENPECNFNHYVQTGLYPPITAEEMRVWEILKFFKRDFFIWTTVRTVKDYDMKKLTGVMANADHINPELPGFEDSPPNAPHRYDSFRYRSYGTTMKKWLNEFLEERPDYKKVLGIEDALEVFSEDDVVALMKNYGMEWMDYILPRIREKIKKQSEEIRKDNPNFRRSAYGPWSAYNATYGGGYYAKWFGYDITKHHEIFDGYVQLEDYPYSCAYRTTRCAWAIMTTKLLNHKLRIHPELYFNFPAGCPDLAVTCAYPPFGDSISPTYFSVTQICEYVYATAYFDKKFDYWRDYGFAPLQFIDESDNRMRSILSLWKKILENSPSRPLKTTAFIYDINPKEDRNDLEIKGGNFYNISETNLSYVYDLMKANGFPGGFGAMLKDIPNLTEKDVSAIVLPDMTNAPKDVIKKLRELHKKGVTLVAVSRTGELADLFGVKENIVKKHVNTLFLNGREEFIYPIDAEFFHENVSGEVVLSANDDIPVIIKSDNAIVLNTPIAQVGIDSLSTIDYNGRPNISKFMKEALKSLLQGAVSTIATSSDDTGISILKTEKGETLLLLIDYSKYSQKDREVPRLCEIQFNEKFKDIEYINVCNDDIKLGKKVENGVLKNISVMIRPQEALIFKLK